MHVDFEWKPGHKLCNLQGFGAEETPLSEFHIQIVTLCVYARDLILLYQCPNSSYFILFLK